ncbi:MAG: hypothetical protein M1503_00465 [Thaumarchaeota archaeon]|nr:hypothetical protein [Nitrososphaerota archaeon]MCL5316725.1 hypothetical protein [Nitrososphaerota archaeon]
MMGRILKIVGASLFVYGVLTGISMLYVPDSYYNQYYFYYLGQTGISVLLGILLFKRGGRKKQEDDDYAKPESTTKATVEEEDN